MKTNTRQRAATESSAKVALSKAAKLKLPKTLTIITIRDLEWYRKQKSCARVVDPSTVTSLTLLPIYPFEEEVYSVLVEKRYCIKETKAKIVVRQVLCRKLPFLQQQQHLLRQTRLVFSSSSGTLNNKQNKSNAIMSRAR